MACRYSAIPDRRSVAFGQQKTLRELQKIVYDFRIMARREKQPCPATDCTAARPRQSALTEGQRNKIAELQHGAAPMKCDYCHCVYVLALGGTKRIIGHFVDDDWYPRRSN